MEVTFKNFESLPIGQKFIESCCSGSTFLRAVKISASEVEILKVDSFSFNAFLSVEIFNPDYHWLEAVDNFQDDESLEELKEFFNCF